MAIFMVTELGNRVPMNDWLSFHRDRLLSVLDQMRRHGVPQPAAQVSMIAGITGLPEQDAMALAKNLVENRLLVEYPPGTYRLSPDGILWVAESPRG